MKKELKDMTEKEILRKQLELLAEVSKNVEPNELAQLSNAMTNIYECIVSVDTEDYKSNSNVNDIISAINNAYEGPLFIPEDASIGKHMIPSASIKKPD